MPDYGVGLGGVPLPPIDLTPDLADLQWPWSPAPPGAPTPAEEPAIAPIQPQPAEVPAPPAPEPAAAPPAAIGGTQPPAAPPVDQGAPAAAAPTLPPPIDADLAGNPALPPLDFAPPQDAPLGLGQVGLGQLPEQHYQATQAAYAHDPLAIPDDAEQARALDALDPYAFSDLLTHHEADRAAMVDKRKREMLDADLAAQQANNREHQESIRRAQAKSDAILADSQRLADTKVDPTGGVRGYRAIAGVIGAIVGGLVQGRTGAARNAGMDALNETINRGIEAQKADLANQRENIGTRRSALAEEYARSGDMYQAEESVRRAALLHADALLALDQQNWDPRGTTALKSAAMRRDIATQIAQGDAARAQRLLENELKVRKQALDEAQLRQKEIQDRRQIGLGYAQLDSQKADRKEAREARAADRAAALEDKKLENARKENLERGLSGEVTPVLDGKGNVVGRKLGPITMADGSTFIPKGTEATITSLQKKHVAAVQLVQTLDEIRRLGPEWLSDTANSDKLQRLNQLMGDARLQAIAAKDLGVPTGHDIELAENFLGTSDATRRKDSIAGLVQSRASIVRDHNAELKARGLDKDWNPEDLSAVPAAAATEADRMRQALFEKPTQTFDDVAREAIGERQRGLTPDERRSQEVFDATVRGGIEEARRTFDPDASPKQQREIARLGTIAGGSGPEAEDARKTLRDVAAGAHTARLRELANQALLGAVTSSVLQGGEPEQVR